MLDPQGREPIQQRVSDSSKLVTFNEVRTAFERDASTVSSIASQFLLRDDIDREEANTTISLLRDLGTNEAVEVLGTFIRHRAALEPVDETSSDKTLGRLAFQALGRIQGEGREDSRATEVRNALALSWLQGEPCGTALLKAGIYHLQHSTFGQIDLLKETRKVANILFPKDLSQSKLNEQQLADRYIRLSLVADALPENPAQAMRQSQLEYGKRLLQDPSTPPALQTAVVDFAERLANPEAAKMIERFVFQSGIAKAELGTNNWSDQRLAPYLHAVEAFLRLDRAKLIDPGKSSDVVIASREVFGDSELPLPEVRSKMLQIKFLPYCIRELAITGRLGELQLSKDFAEEILTRAPEWKSRSSAKHEFDDGKESARVAVLIAAAQGELVGSSRKTIELGIEGLSKIAGSHRMVTNYLPALTTDSRPKQVQYEALLHAAELGDTGVSFLIKTAISERGSPVAVAALATSISDPESVLLEIVSGAKDRRTKHFALECFARVKRESSVKTLQTMALNSEDGGLVIHALRQIAEHGGAAGRAFLVALAQGQIDYEASPYELPQEGMKVIDAHVRKLAEAQLLEPPAARAEMHVALRELHSEDLMIDNPIKAILLLKDRIRTHPAGDEQDAAVWSLALNYGEDGRIALQDLSMELAGNSASALFKNVSEQITSNLEQEFRIEGPSAVENAQRAIQLLDELSKSSDRSEPCSMEEREQIVDAARTLDSIVYDEAELNSALLVQASSTLGKAAVRRLRVLIERSAAEPNTALVVSALIATKTHEGLLSLENHLAGEVLPLLRIAAKDPESDESQRSLAARIYWDHISKEELLKAPEVALFPMLGPQKDGEALALEANQWDLKSALTLHRHLMEQDVIEGSPLPEPTIRLLAQLKSDTQLIDLSAQEREILFRFSTLSIERVSSGTPSSSREIAADILLKNGEHQQMLKRMLLESAPDVIAHIVNGSKGDSLIQILKDAPSDEAIQMLQRYLVSDDVKRDERLALLVTDGTDLTLRERALKELPADSTLRTETIETLRLRAVKAEEDNERVAARTLLNSIDVATSAWENLWDRVRFSVRRRR